MVHQLDLWSYYLSDHQLRIAAKRPAALPAATDVALHEDADAASGKPPNVLDTFVNHHTRGVNRPCWPVREIRHPTDLVGTRPSLCLGARPEAAAFKASQHPDKPPEPLELREASFRRQASTERSTADADLTEPSTVKDATYQAAFATPPHSATIADRNPSVQIEVAATDCGAATGPPAAPAASTSFITDANAFAASAANFHRKRGHSNRRRRRRDQEPSSKAHGLDARTELYDAIAEQGP
ncbi:hypothetical protein AAVH_23290 [Aphelenchoides avenae]|nr:hypothetical protein AAVH_23290 [Aphelenchus avenae]